MSETPAAVKVRSTRHSDIGLARMFGYGAGNLGLSMLGLVIAVNLQFFYTDYVGLAAGYAGLSLLVAKLFDAATDPLMGYLSDRTNTRWGRRRPYFVGAAIPLGVAFFFLFSPPQFDDPANHQFQLWLYMLGLYVATYFVWTIAAIPYGSLGAELTDDYDERVKVYAVREVCALTGLLAATFLPGFLIYFYGGRTGYSIMAAILGLVAAGFLIFAGFATKEREEFQGRKPMSPYKAWVNTFQNPHFRKLLLAFIFSSIAAAVPAILIIYIATYIVGMPDWWQENVPGWLPTWSFYLLVYFGGGIVALPFWNRLSKRVGKRNSWTIAIAISAAGSAGCALLGDGTVLLYTVLMAILGAAYSNYMALPSSIVADLIDWDESQTGRRREGSYFAIIAFVLKTCAALTGFTCLMILQRVGYNPGVPQTEFVKTWMLGLYSWFPAAFYSISALMLLRFRFSRADLYLVQQKLGREQVE